MPKKRTGPIPLRLRRRRDGSLTLVDADGRWESHQRAFPTEHVFSHEWLLDSGAAQYDDDDRLTITLANARATYRVLEHDTGGVSAELVDHELFDAPPIDEDRAAEIAAARGQEG